MKKRKILHEDHSSLLSKIVTDICLPATVFFGLSQFPIHEKQILPSLVMLFIELTTIGLAWLITSILKLPRQKQGAIIFCSAFGSSTFLGYPLIINVFPESEAALSEAVIMSEIGVGYPLFILGPLLAIYFSSSFKEEGIPWKLSLSFFKSPVFFAFIIGVAWKNMGLPGPDNFLFKPIFQLASVLKSALLPLVILSVGLMFKKIEVRKILLPIIIVVAIKLIIKPLMANYTIKALNFPDTWREIAVILDSMPSAFLGVVFIKRFGGNSELASSLLLTTTILSAVTLPVLFTLLF